MSIEDDLRAPPKRESSLWSIAGVLCLGLVIAAVVYILCALQMRVWG